MKSWWLVCVALVSACGGGSSTPTTPSIPHVSRITVTGSDLVLVGDSETFAAAGDTGALTAPRWGSDAPTVATVDPNTGRVTAVGTGTATIFVDADGIRGTKLTRTLPNFGGSWKGGFQETVCEVSGGFVIVHSCNYWDLASGKTTMTLTQNRDRISGSFAFGPVEVSGSVSPEGILSFSGTVHDKLTRELQNVRFESTQNGQMTGTFDVVWSSGTTSLSGSLRVSNELRGMRRVSGE
jgi:hypothetical protein